MGVAGNASTIGSRVKGKNSNRVIFRTLYTIDSFHVFSSPRRKFSVFLPHIILAFPAEARAQAEEATTAVATAAVAAERAAGWRL
jgi:hypothetical protein